MNNNWTKNVSLEQLKEKDRIMYLAKEFSIEPLIMKMIFERGCKDYNEINYFLKPEPSNLLEPYYLRDMKKAVDRICTALEKNERIMVFGDYDADGMTATSILFKALRILKSNVSFYIPKRTEGYGLSLNAVEKFAEEDVSLIITVDNGTSSHEAVARGKQRGVDVIVTDHHEILKTIPNCYAFINPKRSDNIYPFSDLSGAGVALKLVQGVFFERGLWNKYKMEFFELAALGTIGDLVPLRGENRLIAQLGIEKMMTSPSKGLKVLFDLLKLNQVTSSCISYSILPILNSIGRLSNPNFIVQILTSNSCEEKLKECWKKVIRLNETRKTLLHNQLLQAELLINLNEINKRKVIVVAGDFHEGITGLLASRISEKYKKPSIVISSSGKGAARCFNGSTFSFVKAIDTCSEFLKTYNGHHAAMELNVYLDRFQHFRQRIQNCVKDVSFYNGYRYEERISIFDFPKQIHDQIKLLEPFGKGNIAPVFYGNEAVDRIVYFGNKDQHVKFQIGDKEALLFFKGNEFKTLANGLSNLECLFTPQTSNFNQFIIQDFKI